MFLIRNIAAFLFLCVFTTPQIANVLHQIIHTHKNVCNDAHIHIHEKRIDCKYEDFIGCSIEPAALVSVQFYNSNHFIGHSFYYLVRFLPNAPTDINGRGPPFPNDFTV